MIVTSLPAPVMITLSTISRSPVLPSVSVLLPERMSRKVPRGIMISSAPGKALASMTAARRVQLKSLGRSSSETARQIPSPGLSSGRSVRLLTLNVSASETDGANTVKVSVKTNKMLTKKQKRPIAVLVLSLNNELTIPIDLFFAALVNEKPAINEA